jgi:hypothetical protein
MYRRRGPPFCRGLDGLTIDDPSTGLPLFAGRDAHISPEHVMDMLPGPIVTPSPKVMVDHRPWREVMGQQPPGTAAPHQIPQGIANVTFGVFLWAAPSFGRGHEMLNQLPFSICQVCGIRLSRFHARNCTLSHGLSEDLFNTL